MNQTAAGWQANVPAVSRKVRAPQGMMPGNSRAGEAKAPSDRQRNRKYTA